jgi:hypothetical protein
MYLVLMGQGGKKSVSVLTVCFSLPHLRMGKLYKESYANMYAALNVRNALDKLINALQSPRGGRLERRGHNNISSTTSTRPAPRRDYTSEIAKCHPLVSCMTRPAAASSVGFHQLATPRITTTTTPKKKPISTVSEPTSPPVLPTPKLNLTTRLEPGGPPETPYSSTAAAAAPIKCSPVVECCTTSIDPKMTISLPSRDGHEGSNCRPRIVDSGLTPMRDPEQYQGFGTPRTSLAGSKSHSKPNPHLNLNSSRGGKRPSSRSSLTSELSELGAEYACHIPPHLHDQVTTLHRLELSQYQA